MDQNIFWFNVLKNNNIKVAAANMVSENGAMILSLEDCMVVFTTAVFAIAVHAWILYQKAREGTL